MSTGLVVRDLHVAYGRTGAASTPAVDAVGGVGFDIAAGETLGLVGESGCGKSTIALALTRSLPASATVTGTIRLGDTEVDRLHGAALRSWWSSDVAMVYQDPQAALNPTMRVGAQIAEVLRARGAGRQAAAQSAIDLIARVALADPDQVARRYPHQLSGGQQQRIVIAMALAVRPTLLILDEPTTGLDATVEREILHLIAELRTELSAAVLFITHDLGLVESMCDRVAVMEAGTIREIGPIESVLVSPTHPYTRHLLDSTIAPGRTKHNDPALRDDPPPAPPSRAGTVDPPLLRAHDVGKRFGSVAANDGVSLTVRHGEVVGLVGESGSGKTTLGRIVAGLTVPDSGSIELRGEMIAPDLRRRPPAVRRSIQMVFQNPDSTLNPKHRVRRVLQRAIRKLQGTRSVDDLAGSCRLELRLLDQLTSTLSGGQKQRVAIARALAGDADLVVCDEPVSALDVSVQATILRLLVDVQRERWTGLLFISHDLAVVRYLADRIAVMYAGRIVEEGPTEAVLAAPHHPYTAQLLAASEHRELPPETGGASAASATRGHSAAAGCAFASRCPNRIAGLCDTAPPPTRELAGGLRIECHLDLQPAPGPPPALVR